MLEKVKNQQLNKFLLYSIFFFYLLNLISFFVFKLNFEFDGYLYSVSNFDILISKGISSISFPGWIKSLSFICFFSGLSSIFFLVKKKYREFIVLSSCFTFFPVSFLLLNISIPQIKIMNSEVLYFYLFFSLMSDLIFRSCLGIGSSFRHLLKIVTMLCSLVLFVISFYLISSGVPAISEIGFLKFLTGTEWAPTKHLFGILPFISCSLMVTFGALLIGVPIGILTAVFLSEFSHPVLSKIINVFIKVIAGIPSVVLGFFGMLIVAPLVRKMFYNYTSGDCLLTAMIILSIMILPTIISMSEHPIRYSSKRYLEPSLALGESKARSIFKVVVPAAKNEIISAVFLGLGRAFGETMAVIMVSGNSVNMPHLLKSSRFLTTAMALEFSYASGLHKKVLYSIGLVLFSIIIILNVIFIIFLRRGKKNG